MQVRVKLFELKEKRQSEEIEEQLKHFSIQHFNNFKLDHWKTKIKGT